MVHSATNGILLCGVGYLIVVGTLLTSRHGGGHVGWSGVLVMISVWHYMVHSELISLYWIVLLFRVSKIQYSLTCEQWFLDLNTNNHHLFFSPYVYNNNNDKKKFTYDVSKNYNKWKFWMDIACLPSMGNSECYGMTMICFVIC